MRAIEGDYETIRTEELDDDRRGEYISIVLKDRRLTPDISSFFRNLYRSRDSILMEIRSEYNHFDVMPGNTTETDNKSIGEMFSEFYTDRRGGEPPDEADYSVMDYAAELMNAADISLGPDEKIISRLVEHLLETEAEQ